MLDADHCTSPINNIECKENGNTSNDNDCENSEKCETYSDNCGDTEGGWGYMVCLGLATVFIIGIGPMSSIGLLYEDFLESIGEVTRALALTFGIGNAMVAFAGMFTTCALKKFSLRQVGLFGAALFCTSSALAIFVNSLTTFVLVNGIIQPIGFGILMPISLTSFNTYFHKKRSSMMSLVSVMVGAGAMAFPILIETLMEMYGFRGTLTVLCAINLNVIPSISVMQPVQWHIKQVKRGKTIKKGKSKENTLTVFDVNCNDDSVTTANKPLISVSFVAKIVPSIAEISHNKKSLDEYMDKNNLTKSPSLASLGNRTGNAMVTEAFSSGGKWKGIVDYLDLKLLKDPVYCNICLGMTLSVFADITFFTLEPAILSSLNFNKIQIAYCITAGAFADLISRIIFAFASFYIKLKSRIVFFIGNAFMIVFRIAFMQSTDTKYLMAVTGCLGFFRHWILMSSPLVFAEHFGIEKFPAAYGLNMLISGIANLLLGPLTGFIKDITGDFNMVVCYLVICSMLCSIPWAVEFACHKNKLKSRRYQ